MYAQDHIIIPTVIIEHGHPDHLRLPAIYEYATNVLYEGLDECVQFFEQHTGITNVLSESAAFKVLHPCFRIYDVGGKVTKHDL
jgi:hypothetical protein